jgi:hypothetical protein
MKLDIKTLSLIVILGSLFYCVSSYTKSKLISNSPKNDNKEIIVINKIENSSKLISPKVYISVPPAQNGLEIGNNWKSK